ncbi:MAG: fibronectin type III domain-containing protein [Micrococcales bacterium]|nr:fibronectin type III domain-containing protein [Micrococcales bacterium]
MKPRWTAAAILVAAMALVAPPMTANAATLPAPTSSTPTAGATVDQPVFAWSPVTGADRYEIEVALDDQFVTVTDPGDEAVPRGVHGTTYVRTFSYTAKTHYWHVRAVAANGDEGAWSATREFTRRWTNTDEPAGAAAASPGSRVENVRLVSGGNTPPLNRVAITWDPVPGASHYEVEIDPLSTDVIDGVVCKTPHSAFAPPFESSYARRSALSSCATVQSPVRSWVGASEWSSPGPDQVAIQSDDIQTGDFVYVRFLNEAGDQVVVDPFPATVTSVGGDPRTFTVTAPTIPGDPDAQAQYFRVALPMESGAPYAVRVRAVDVGTGPDYPGTTIYGIWSNQRPEPGAPLGSWLTFTVTDPVTGSGVMWYPAMPDELSMSGTDVPLLSWEPAAGADGYAVTVALDGDFTNLIATYQTRAAMLVPPETYDDNGPNRSYYWHVEPCVYDSIAEDDLICLVDDYAINDPAYVGRFSKHSAPAGDLSATSTDGGRNAVLRWGDALTASQALDSSFSPGGVMKYELQYTATTWAAARSVKTDNLAYGTSVDTPPAPGTYRWRVRPVDGQEVPLAWAVGPDFTIGAPADAPADPTEPAPTPSDPPQYQQPSFPGTVTQNPPAAPGKPRVQRWGKKFVKVRWRAAEEHGSPVDRYLVYRSTNGTSFKIVKRTTETAAKIKAQRTKTSWFYVIAQSDAGRSKPSRTVKFPR